MDKLGCCPPSLIIFDAEQIHGGLGEVHARAGKQVRTDEAQAGGQDPLAARYRSADARLPAAPRWQGRAMDRPKLCRWGEVPAKPIGMADDYEASNGDSILNYAEAVERVRQSYHTGQDRPLSILTVADAIADYVIWLKTHKATGRDAEVRARKLILPTLGKIRLSDLTTRQLTNWRDALAKQPALIRSRPGAPQITVPLQ